jgi:hypothetical protein
LRLSNPFARNSLPCNAIAHSGVVRRTPAPVATLNATGADFATGI